MLKIKLVSTLLKSILLAMGIISIINKDWLWAFACFFGFLLSIFPIIIKKSLKFSIPWVLEFLLVFAISLHIWGIVGLYSLPFYDKIAHFLASAIISFFALIIVYILDVFSPRIHMDLLILAFFIFIFTLAMGTIWEIIEFAYDNLLYEKPFIQISLQNTMWDLIADGIAGIIVATFGTMALRRGEFKGLLASLSKEAKKLDKRFIEARKKALNSLKEAKENGKVDKKILPLIEKINEKMDFFTTSSCSGRIAILEIPSFGIKKKANFLGKWHEEISFNQLKEAIKKARKGEIWLLVQSPILHVSTISMENAKKLLRLAMDSGFKYSSIKALNGRIVVEILSTERIDMPLGKDGKIFANESYLNVILDIANRMLKIMEEKLKRLEEKIEGLKSFL